MNRADRRAWATAETLADLGALMTGFLHGRLGESPVHCGPVDQLETGPYIPVLAAACAAGFVTTVSQAGDSRYGWQANAWGYITGEGLAVLREVTGGTRLVIRHACRGRVHEGHRRLGFRACPKADEDCFMERRCPRACRVLEDAWLIEIADPVPGRNDVLWPALGRFAARATGGTR